MMDEKKIAEERRALQQQIETANRLQQLLLAWLSTRTDATDDALFRSERARRLADCEAACLRRDELAGFTARHAELRWRSRAAALYRSTALTPAEATELASLQASGEAESLRLRDATAERLRQIEDLQRLIREK